MIVETLIGPGNELSVETPFVYARLVSTNHEDCFAFRVEGKGNTPNPVGRMETQLLHVGVARPFQRIGARTAEPWPEFLQQAGVRQ
jgi:hypothetical protein